MSRYTHESPMDFEFQNGTGPLDGRSPFAQVSQNAQRFPLSPNKKRSYSAYDSPSKSKPSHTPSPSKPLPPPPPAFNALFSTPRKPHSNDIDDSSAGETPRSPEQRDDSDAQTPDTNTNSMNPLRNALSRIDPTSISTLPGAERTSLTKEKPNPVRRESWLTKAKNKFYSPGRGEVPRADHSHAMEKRIEKRRKRDVDRKVSRKRRHSMSEYSEDDSEHPRASPRKTSGQQKPEAEGKQHWISALWSFIEQHPTVPHILSWYAQLFFNIFLLCCFAWVIFSFWSAIQGDVDKHTHEAMADIMAEMAACAEQYTQNKCDRSTRVPAMETVCENWNKCMNRDPARVGRAKVSAHTFAEIFNSFLEPISWKAMIFTLILIFGCFAISNFAFGFFRKTEGNAPPPNWGYYQQPPPPTPQRQFSGQDGGYYGTPWHQPMAGLEPQASQGAGYGQIEGRGSPVRRLQYQ